MGERAGLRAAAGEIRSATGSDGIAASIASADWALPGSTTEHVVYDLALAIGLWGSDVAGLLDLAAEPAEPS